MSYVIMCASTVDINPKLLREKDIEWVNFKFIVDGKEYEDDFFESYPYEKFYNDISGGMEPTTSQVGYGTYYQRLEKVLKDKKDALVIALSSGISGDFSTLRSVAMDLNEKYENKVYVCDSKSASCGYGILALMAADNRAKGMSVQDNLKWVEENKLRVNTWFISTDLSSFIRGGRISKTSGFFGTMLKICPLLTIAKNGELLPLEKIRTKTKAIEALFDRTYEFTDNGLDYDGYLFVANTMLDEDAQKIKEELTIKYPKAKIEVFHVGTTIGTHTGPGVLGTFFMGQKDRTFEKAGN